MLNDPLINLMIKKNNITKQFGEKEFTLESNQFTSKLLDYKNPSFSLTNRYDFSIFPILLRLNLSNIENELNSSRFEQYKGLTEKLLQLIKDSDLEYGFDSQLDLFLKEKMQQNALATKEWINSVFIEYFDNVDVTTGILRTIAHMSYNEIAPQGITITLAALSHTNPEVKECGIRAYENWANPECLKILRNVDVSEKWLKDYISQVISDFEEDFV